MVYAIRHVEEYKCEWKNPHTNAKCSLAHFIRLLYFGMAKLWRDDSRMRFKRWIEAAIASPFRMSALTLNMPQCHVVKNKLKWFMSLISFLLVPLSPSPYLDILDIFKNLINPQNQNSFFPKCYSLFSHRSGIDSIPSNSVKCLTSVCI